MATSVLLKHLARQQVVRGVPGRGGCTLQHINVRHKVILVGLMLDVLNHGVVAIVA